MVSQVGAQKRNLGCCRHGDSVRAERYGWERLQLGLEASNSLLGGRYRTNLCTGYFGTQDSEGISKNSWTSWPANDNLQGCQGLLNSRCQTIRLSFQVLGKKTSPAPSSSDQDFDNIPQQSRQEKISGHNLAGLFSLKTHCASSLCICHVRIQLYPKKLYHHSKILYQSCFPGHEKVCCVLRFV